MIDQFLSFLTFHYLLIIYTFINCVLNDALNHVKLHNKLQEC